MSDPQSISLDEERTYALMVENAQGMLSEISKDYERLKRDTQQILTISAVLLGLLLNLVRLPEADQWPIWMDSILSLATLVLFITAAFSLLTQRSRTFMIGYINPEYLHNNFSHHPPVEIYRAHLDALQKSLKPADEKVKRLSKTVNVLRYALVAATMLIGVVILSSVNLKLIEQIVGAIF